MISLNDKFLAMDIKKDNNITKLVNELCAMTGCDQEQAYMQLSSCDFDFESAANKVLESSSTNKQIDSEWQIINRQKKSKKKQEKVDAEPISDGFKKNDSNRHPKFKNPNQKGDHFKNEDKLINNRVHRNKRNRFAARKPKEITEAPITNNERLATTEPFIVSDSENELRWDYIGDFDGALKESSNNSQGDGFYSEDDFGANAKLDDHSYCGLSTQLVSEIHQKYKSKTHLPTNEIPREQSYSSQAESQIVNEYLSNQLPIFGRFCQTPLPQSMPIIPDRPVSFYRAIKPKMVTACRHYNFGINLKNQTTVEYNVDQKSRNLTDDSGKIITSPEQTKFFLNRNLIVSPNDQNIVNAQFPPPGIMTKDIEVIRNKIIQQQKVVAMLFGNTPTPNYYEFPNPINMISIPNSNHVEQMYAMNRYVAGLHPNMENGMTIPSQDGFVSQSTFLTSNNMSVPFHANRK